MSNPFFGILVGGLILFFPLIIAVFVNLFCLRITKEIAPRHRHVGSIVTSPFLYLYFLCVYPITLIIMWFPAGLSLLLLYGEHPDKNLVLPSSLDEQMLVFLFFILLMSLIVLGFSLRAGELYRNPASAGHLPHDPSGPGTYPPNNLQIPMSMLV